MRMQKLNSRVLPVVMMTILPISALADQAWFVRDGITYYFESDSRTEVYVKGIAEDATSVTIPGQVTYSSYRVGTVQTVNKGGTSKVMRIGYAAHGNSSLNSVTIEYGVTNIGAGAFRDCENLTSVTIPNSVVTIGSAAFAACSRNLKRIMIPDSVEKIEDGAFSGCFNMTHLTLGNGLKNIGYGAFEECRSLECVAIPDSVTNLGAAAFANCHSLTNLTLGNSLRSIEGRAFDYCGALTKVNIPNSVETIGSRSFAVCTNLTTVTLGDGLRNIGDYAFYVCRELKDVKVPYAVTNIGEHAFERCYNLKRMTIPDTVSQIGGSVFLNCTNLTSVTLGASVKNIPRMAFGGCSSLKSVALLGSAPTVEGLACAQIAKNATAYRRRDATGFGSVKTWQGMNLVYIPDPASSNGKGMILQGDDGGYDISAYDGETLTEDDIKFTALMDGEFIDTTSGYAIEIDEDGKTAKARLKEIMLRFQRLFENLNPHQYNEGFGFQAYIIDQSDDTIGTTQAGDDPSSGNEGTMVVDAVPGLWYQASWGDSLDNMESGDKVQAEDETLRLSVIYQTGDSGFYKLTVSDE